MIYLLYISGGAVGAMLHSCSDSLEKAKEFVSEFEQPTYNESYPVTSWWICEMKMNSKLSESKEVARGAIER